MVVPEASLGALPRAPKGPRGALRRAGLAGLAAAFALVAAGHSGAAQQTRDQVIWLDRDGQVRTTRGVVRENTLAHVLVETDGEEEEEIAANLVRRISFGSVPVSYQEALRYLERGDYENAARMFQVVATEAQARGVLRADARLQAGRAWLRRGAQDPAAFEEGRQELERFLAEHPDHRQVPEARALLARATWLAGDPAAAAETYRELYGEAASGEPSEGYSFAQSYRAGIDAVDALLAAGEIDAARALAREIEAGAGTVLSSLAEDDPDRQELETIQAEARLAEGFALLAADQADQARSFFQRQLTAAEGGEGPAALRFGARLGLASALLALGQAREAQVEFAQVSALDHTDPDRVARALTGMAQAALELAGVAARQDAERWLELVLERYGDTPAVLLAQELSQELK